MSVPTMKDVAREAGVALGTVSKVFNDIPVGDSYRRKVMDAAGRLGYQVNSYARGLKASKTYSAALIIPNIVTPFFAALAQGVCQSLTRRGYRTMLSLTDAGPEEEQRAIQMAKQNKVDGVIGLTYNPALTIDELLPYVSIDRCFSSNVPCVASDNYGGGRMAAEKLLELGCARPLFFRSGSTVPGESDKRRDGFAAVCRQHGVEFQELWLDDEDGYEPFREYLAAHRENGVPDYDGIFCINDELAFKTIRMLRGLSLRVPEDVQIIGYDGVPMHFSGKPPCSTIVQPVQEMAETAVEMLLQPERNGNLVCLPVRYAAWGTTREDGGKRQSGQEPAGEDGA